MIANSIQFFKYLGPGIVVAAAAVGASHLVSATRAGASFGFELWWLLILVHALKYPFFYAGYKYTQQTNQHLIEGYAGLNRWYIFLFIPLSVIAGIGSLAGVSMLTAAMLTLILPFDVTSLSIGVILVSISLLVIGHYRLLDNLSKFIIIGLAFVTVIIVAMTASTTPISEPLRDPWQWANLGFFIAFMGWMPAPIEVSVWNSIWLKRKMELSEQSRQYAGFDFNIGYAITLLLALCFLSLGALIMHPTGQEFSSSGAQFSNQFVSLYKEHIGGVGASVITVIAILCMFTTTITVLDGYARSIKLSLQELSYAISYGVTLVALGAVAALLVSFFKGALLPLLELVMAQAFLTTAIFAWLNWRLLLALPVPHSPKWPMKLLAYSGLLFFVLLSLLYLWNKLS